jgi:hypothetical protein
MTIKQIIEQNQLPINMRNGKAMSVLGNYVRDEIFGVGNPITFDKVEENNNMVNDYPEELIPHVVFLIKEAFKKNPEWSTAKRRSY